MLTALYQSKSKKQKMSARIYKEVDQRSYKNTPLVTEA